MGKSLVRTVFLLFVYALLVMAFTPLLAWAQPGEVGEASMTQNAVEATKPIFVVEPAFEPDDGINALEIEDGVVGESVGALVDDSSSFEVDGGSNSQIGDDAASLTFVGEPVDDHAAGEDSGVSESDDTFDASAEANVTDVPERANNLESENDANADGAIASPKLMAGAAGNSVTASGTKAVATPTKFWIEPSAANKIPSVIDGFKVKTGGTTTNPTYTYEFYLPGDAVVSNCFLSWDGGATVTIDGVSYASGEHVIPNVGAQVSYTFKNDTQSLLSTTFATYQGSASVPAIFIVIDESEGHNTIAQMDADDDHEIECTGLIYIDGVQYELSKMKGRGNATWKESDDKKPYNITLGTKINFPGIDSEKTKKWSLLAENLDHSLMGNRTGYELAHLLGIGQDTTSADVWMNGEYQGCYTVTPKTDSFVTKNGFMIEQDNYLEGVENGGDPQFQLDGLNEVSWPSTWTSRYNRISVKKIGDNLLKVDGVVVDTPENQDAVAQNVIKPWLQDAWDAIRSDTGFNSKGKYYTDYIDIESFAKMYLMFEYVKSYDVCAGSILFYRDGMGENDKLIAGPLWDLDNAMGSVYQNGSLGRADDRRNGDRRSAEGYFIDNITEYKTSIYKTLSKHSDFMQEVLRQYNYYKWAFDGAADHAEQMKSEIAASAQMNHIKVNDLGNGQGKNNHYYGSQTTLGTGEYQQVYKATTNSKTDWENYADNMITYIRVRSLWFASPDHYMREMNIAVATIGGIAAQTYSGSAFTPDTTVVLDGMTLIKDKHYAVSYDNNVNAGTASFTITGIDNYVGAVLGTFVIDAANIANAVASAAVQTYSGLGLTPAVAVVLDGRTLVEGRDFTVVLTNNVNAGNAVITVTGKDNYTGTANGAFLIVPAAITIKADAMSKVYGTGDPALTATVVDKPAAGVDPVYSLSRAVGENVGSYAITVVPGVNPNYEVTAEGATFAISRAKATVTADAKSRVYGQSDPALTATVAGVLAGDEIAYSLSRAAGEGAGTYAIAPSGAAVQGNYDVEYVPAKLTISRAKATVTADAKSKVYGQSDPALTATVAGLVNGDSASVVSYTVTRASGEGAGTYAIAPSGAAVQGNYDVEYVPAKLTISRAKATVTADAKSKVYGQSDPALTATVAGLVNGDSASVIAYSLSRAAGENVGSYAITVTVGENPNYEVSASGATFAISRAKATVTADAKSKVYGQSDPALTATVSGLVNGDSASVVSYTVARASGEGAGTYAIAPSGAAVQGNYDVTYAPANFTVFKRPATVTAANASKVYGENDPDLVAAVDGAVPGETLSYAVSRAAGENVGSYAITVTPGVNPNYEVAVQGATFEISRAKATVAADAKSKVYGEDDPALTATVTGLVNGDAADVISRALSRQPGEGFGNYVITVTGDAVQGNYDVVYVDGVFSIVRAKVTVTANNASKVYGDADPTFTATVEGAPVGYEIVYSLSRAVGEDAGEYAITPTGATVQDNYSVEYVPAKLTISKKTATVTAANASKVYGQSDPVLTATVAGALAGDEIAYSLSRAAGEDAGGYAITVAPGANPNYEVSVQGATFTISRAKATVTADAKSKVYGQSDPVLTVTVAGLKNGDAASAISYSVSRASGNNVGTYAIVPAGNAVQGNYDVSFVSGLLIVSKKAATVAANNASKVHGQSDPALTATVTGALSGDRIAYTLSRVTGESVGSYAISVKLGSNPNYDVTIRGATFTITMPKVSGEGDPNLTVITSWNRLAGDAALDTMSKIVDAGNFAKGGIVVLATSGGYWDALTAAGVAGMSDAPILMTDGKELSSQTVAQIKKLAPSKVVICGGTVAVSDDVKRQISSIAGKSCVIERCYGSDAVGTAIDIFQRAPRLTGGKWSATAFVCTNDGYWDALAAAPISYSEHMPIFLTNGKNSIDSRAISAMKAGGVKNVWIVGGTAAISDAVRSMLDRSGIKVNGRLAGNTAIETSEAVAGHGLKLGMTADSMGVATTSGYWDALSGAALCGKKHSVLVLVSNEGSHSISGFTKSHAKEVIEGYIFGGTAVISNATAKALANVTGGSYSAGKYVFTGTIRVAKDTVLMQELHGLSGKSDMRAVLMLDKPVSVSAPMAGAVSRTATQIVKIVALNYTNWKNRAGEHVKLAFGSVHWPDGIAFASLFPDSTVRELPL